MTEFPDNKRFAFTILDDTDDSTTENVRPIYALLRDLGLRTTKTAWPMDCPEGSPNYFAAETLQDPDYLAFVKELVESGFELASHGATMESSRRERTLQGLQVLESEFGEVPRLHCNHGQNQENVYWGPARYRTWPFRLAASLFERNRSAQHRYEGHDPSSPYFWGDACKEHFHFVRNFTFTELDLSTIPPGRPYHLPSTPYINYWFTTADAPDAASFNALVTKDSISALSESGGFTIISTHLGKGFVRDGVVDAGVRETLEHVSSLPGWFVPVSELLSFLLSNAPSTAISSLDLYRLEGRHAVDRLRAKYA